MNIAKFRVLGVGFLMIVCAGSVSAQNVTRSISINPYGTYIEGNAEFDFGYNSTVGAQGLIMGDPDFGTSAIRFGFTVPEGYAPGTGMALKVLWRSDEISCVIDLRNSSLYRSPGNGGSTDPGALSRQSTLLAPNDLAQTETTLFNLVGLGDIQSGDAIQGGLFRSSSLDSCSGDFHILGLSILYEAQTSYVFSDRFESGS